MDTSQNTRLSLNRLESSTSSPDMESLPAVLMRKLPRNTSLDVLRTMLLFAKDMVDVNFVDSEYSEDIGYLSAIAHFMSLTGAHEARDKLHGKTISNDAKLMVELYQSGIGNANARRNTVDGTSLRHASSSASSAGSSGGQPNPGTGRQSSRFNGTFQSLEKMSPPSGSIADRLPAPESNATIQSLFSPQSPLANSALSSKSMINDDPGDETGKLLNDPVAFAKSGENTQASFARRPTNPQLPVSRFAGLSLLSTANSTGMVSPPQNGFMSPRSAAPIQSPNSTFSPSAMSPLPGLGGTNSNFQGTSQQHYQRHNYPPVNPADQNPPCNTLYVGNLPVDTSEDELKAMFSKQRGYKRLCFRTKQNGPMCFVEFEDTSFATKALNELYGHPLHNSVKGGIRLSFSKNPLGVRSGQQGLGSGLPPPHLGMPGMGGHNGGFNSTLSPPPGLTPPGLTSPGPMNGGPMNGGSGFGIYNNLGHGMGGGAYPQNSRQPLANNMATTVAGGHYPSGNDYYMGR
ncbi:hypothetical protein EJ08DRAFT_587019 [Tothia fuscella]|uniref:RRM domain-containing protein n=1 Tax=Tothia fuscella TaxID=1048955 RepID=A0A9P4U034_9PEZI|nr:hypothetical protein EJ08DRAFT_587019 [Tothia fuscella]